MLVKIGNRTFNPMEVPIMIILNDQDKENIAKMKPHNDRYCCYNPFKHTSEEMDNWMNNYHKEY